MKEGIRTNLDEQLRRIHSDPNLQDAWAYVKELWNYGYGAGLFDDNALCLPEFDDNDELISWRGRVIDVPMEHNDYELDRMDKEVQREDARTIYARREI